MPAGMDEGGGKHSHQRAARRDDRYVGGTRMRYLEDEAN